MKYIVRLNPRAVDPLTRKVIPERLWEVEQCANKDSEKVRWHCAEVRIESKSICTMYKLSESGAKPWEMEVFGTCVRGADDAIEIRTGAADASGN